MGKDGTYKAPYEEIDYPIGRFVRVTVGELLGVEGSVTAVNKQMGQGEKVILRIDEKTSGRRYENINLDDVEVLS